MKRLTLDDLREALPDLDELRPIFDHLLACSEPDPARAWAGSGQLDTVGSRLLPADLAMSDVTAIATREAERMGEMYAIIGRAAEALASGDRLAAGEAFLAAAALEEGRERADRAEAYATAAFKAVRDERDQGPAALALRRSARAARALGRLDVALSRYGEAYEAGRAISDVRGTAEAAIGAGNVLEEQGLWSESAAWYHTAIESLAALDGPLTERWHAYLNLHIVARSRSALEESLDWLKKAEAEAEAAGDAAIAAPFLSNARAQLQMARGAFEDAAEHLREALAGTANARARVSFRLNLAEALLALGRVLDAVEHAREAEREAIRSGTIPKLPEVYRLLGRIAATEGNPDAFVFFERALELVLERNLPVIEEALTLHAYAEAERRNGDEEAASHLAATAKERLEAVGLTHMRQDWADVYGPEPDEVSSPPHGEDHAE